MRKVCGVLCALLLALFGAGLVAIAFFAVTYIGREWLPLDYWLLWFSIFASVLGLICLVVGIFAAAASVKDFCG